MLETIPRMQSSEGRRALIWPIVLALVLGACTVGPDYRRPAVPTPDSFRGQPPGESPLSLGDLAWWRLFEDEILHQLIQEALFENYDLRIAAARILEARAQVTISRSFQFPELNHSGSAIYSHIQGERTIIPVPGSVRPDRQPRPVVRDRLLGPLPAIHRSGARRPAGLGGLAALRPQHPGDRRGDRVLQPPLARQRAGGLPAHARGASGEPAAREDAGGRRCRRHDRRPPGRDPGRAGRRGRGGDRAPDRADGERDQRADRPPSRGGAARPSAAPADHAAAVPTGRAVGAVRAPAGHPPGRGPARRRHRPHRRGQVRLLSHGSS